MSKPVDTVLLTLRKESTSPVSEEHHFAVSGKMILFFAIFCLALSSGLGAPTTAVYKFVKCNPEDGQANCITHQSADMEWSPDLPTKLPASAARDLEAGPVEDERDPFEEEDEEDEEDVAGDEEEPMTSEEGESAVVFLPEEGSGFEGSAFMADGATAADTGSGEYLEKENYKPTKGRRKNRKGAKWSSFDEQKPTEEEMKNDHLL